MRQRTTALDVNVTITQWLDRSWNRAKKKKKGSAENSGALDGPQTVMLSTMFECMMAKGKKIPYMKEPQTLLRRQVSGRLLGIGTRNWEGACELSGSYTLRPPRIYLYLLCCCG